MSWRQPANVRAAVTKDTKDTKDTKADDRRADGCSSFVPFVPFVSLVLIRNDRHLARFERFENRPRRLDVELRILRLDAEEEPVAAGQREPWGVEHRVIRLRQAVQREHAEPRRQ